MASSEVALANRALDYLGAAAIISLDDNTTAAALCKRGLPFARDAVLRSYPWNCAKRRASLSALVAAPSFEYAYAYPLPADCLRLVAVNDEIRGGIRWRVEGREVLTNEPGPLRVRYVARVLEVGLLDDMVADVISARLAADIGFALTANQGRADAMRAQYEMMHREARRIDAIEASQDDEVTADTWDAARY